jgi:hypothetical protein
MEINPDVLEVKVALLDLKHKALITDQSIRGTLQGLIDKGNPVAPVMLHNWEKYNDDASIKGSGIFDMLDKYAVDIRSTTTKSTSNTDEWGMWDYRNAAATRDRKTMLD